MLPNGATINGGNGNGNGNGKGRQNYKLLLLYKVCSRDEVCLSIQ